MIIQIYEKNKSHNFILYNITKLTILIAVFKYILGIQ